MYLVNKIVGFLASPAGVAFFAFLAAAACAKWGHARLAKATAVAAVVWLWLWMTPVMTRLVGLPLENMSGSPCAVDYRSIPETEVAVLLGGGVGLHGKCGAAEMFAAADRVRVAANLWKAGRVRKIFVTGPDASAGTLSILEDFGVDPAACVIVGNSRNTEEEARDVAKRTGGRIVLVTSAWHMPRAKLLFTRCGLDVIECPADFEMRCAAENDVGFCDFLPNADAFLRNSYALKEWIALVGYRLLR